MKPNYFVEANACLNCRQEHLSPDGAYKLVVTPYSTKGNGWNYTRGEVYRTSDNKLIADVKRNYSQFPFTWVLHHPNGHHYLICGADYQGQTVIELDTKKRKNHLSDDAKKGFGFCWVQHKFDPVSQVLTVGGCVWACPYEYRFYDFSDPINNGWPCIEIVEDWAEDDNSEKWPEVKPDGTVTCYKCNYAAASEDPPREVVDSIKIFKREGLTLVLQNEWVSDEEKANRQQQEKSNSDYAQWWKDFRASDTLYLKYKALLANSSILRPEQYEGLGVTYKGWCPSFDAEEKCYSKQLHRPKTKAGKRITLEWGVNTGPIKVLVSQRGKQFEDKFFEHSEAGMEAAFVYVTQMLTKKHVQKA